MYTGKIQNEHLMKTYSVEITVQNFAVNTIANSEEIMMEDRETALMMQNKSNNPNASSVESLDEMSKVRKGYDYIKKMVKIWIKDVEFYSSNEAS